MEGVICVCTSNSGVERVRAPEYDPLNKRKPLYASHISMGGKGRGPNSGSEVWKKETKDFGQVLASCKIFA